MTAKKPPAKRTAKKAAPSKPRARRTPKQKTSGSGAETVGAHAWLMDRVAETEGKDGTPPAPAVSEQPIAVGARSPAAHLEEFRFQPGQSGNPAGRKKGSRNRLTEAFIADLFDDWAEHGKEAIAATRESKPAEYLKVVAGLAPKKVEVREDPLDDFNDDDITAALAAIAAIRQARDARGEAGVQTETAH